MIATAAELRRVLEILSAYRDAPLNRATAISKGQNVHLRRDAPRGPRDHRRFTGGGTICSTTRGPDRAIIDLALRLARLTRMEAAK